VKADLLPLNTDSRQPVSQLNTSLSYIPQSSSEALNDVCVRIWRNRERCLGALAISSHLICPSRDKLNTVIRAKCGQVADEVSLSGNSRGKRELLGSQRRIEYDKLSSSSNNRPARCERLHGKAASPRSKQSISAILKRVTDISA
jgi:hypothetical protein